MAKGKKDSENKKNSRLKKATVFFLLIMVAVAFYLAGREAITGQQLVFLRRFHHPEELAEYLLSFGGWTVLVSIMVMIIQTLFTPVPLFLVAGANGFVFGIIWGIVVTMTGALIGSSLAFYLARFLARDYVQRRLARWPLYLQKVDELSSREGPKLVFLARLVPVIPASIISYLAGLSSMRFRGFLVASLFGKLPEIIIYTALGHGLGRAKGIAAKATLVLLALTLLAIYLSSSLFGKRCSQETLSYHSLPDAQAINREEVNTMLLPEQPQENHYND